MHSNVYGILAQVAPPTQDNVDGFFNAGIGKFIAGIAAIGAVLIVLYGIFQTGKGLMNGRGAGSVKSLIGSLVVAAFFFNLGWTVDIMKIVVKMVEGVFETLGGVG